MARLVAIARRPRRFAPMEEVGEVAVTGAEGVAGDARGRSPGRQVTVLALEDWRAACAELAAELPWTLRRANLLLEGVILPREGGARLRSGALELEITGETDPCARMDAQHPGLRAALEPEGRGGRTCRVVGAATVRIGDRVAVHGERTAADGGSRPPGAPAG
jgi:MOSC domain-containing protein YiiM